MQIWHSWRKSPFVVFSVAVIKRSREPLFYPRTYQRELQPHPRPLWAGPCCTKFAWGVTASDDILMEENALELMNIWLRNRLCNSGKVIDAGWVESFVIRSLNFELRHLNTLNVEFLERYIKGWLTVINSSDKDLALCKNWVTKRSPCLGLWSWMWIWRIIVF